MGACEPIFAWEAELQASLGRGLSSFGVPDPRSLVEWAGEHFYLSAESSYVEQRWEAWPFQRAILACIGNDDIREVDLIKSARVGYTKMLLAAIAYNAEHRRRNQALWQPTDDDRDEFVKTELDPMLRDVEVMESVFPSYLQRHKDNTLQQKKFLGSMLHLRGGKAAKNYRRISVDCAYLDEADAFDRDVEKEGDPPTLARKRIEGATFPKFVCGSTPKMRGFSLIEDRVKEADALFRYEIPCPHCDEFHALSWGGKDEPTGFKWSEGDPASVRHLCPHCGTLIEQREYLAVAERGRWAEPGGVTIDHAGVFHDAAGEAVAPLAHVAMHVWTAYSPAVAWSDIVREFLAAHAKMIEGDATKLKAFVNTTRGETWEGDIERTDAEELKHRAEPFPLGIIPRGCLLLLVGCDTQDNRIEATVWGYGRGCEKWTIEHRIFFGNPAADEIWQELEKFLFETRYRHVCGTELKIHATAIDSGGHHTQAVYEFARKHRSRRVFAVRGRPSGERAIKDGAGPVDIDWRGKRSKNGVILWHVGTNLAKDLIFSRLALEQHGPGFIHFSDGLSDEWFRQYTGEVRATRSTAVGAQVRWVAQRKRVEALDCDTYATWLETHLELSRKSERWWNELEEQVQPANGDLFAIPEVAGPITPVPAKIVPAPAKAPAIQPPAPAVAPRVRNIGGSAAGGSSWL
jgi:phage terminase large subunit GpA-like protein